MSRYIGNYLRVPSLEPQQASAPGIWSISEQLAYQRANLWPPARDPYYNQTVLHLSGDVAGTKETNPVTQPRTFLSDASLNNFLLTPNGDVSARPFSPYQHSYSVYFGGNYGIETTGVTAIGTNDFAIEVFVYPTAYTYYAGIFGLHTNSSAYGPAIFLSTTGEVNTSIRNGTGTIGLYTSSANAAPLNTWTHIALTRISGVMKTYVNGVLVYSVANTTNCDSTLMAIGQQYADYSPSGRGFTGYISNARAVSGINSVNAFTGTVPAAKLQKITGTFILACHSNRWNYDEGSNYTISADSGTPVVSGNSPFVEYDTTSGSGYFDGTGDYLSAPNNSAFDLSTADFCFGLWIYLPTGSVFRRVLQWQNGSAQNSNYGWVLHIETTNQATLRLFSGTTGYVISNSASPLVPGAWNWVVATRSGTAINVYVNGTGASGSGPATINNPAGSVLYISGDLGASDPFLGYLSNLHIVKGSSTAISSANPSLPLSPVSGTSLLTLQTRAPANNQGILDTSPNSFVVTRTGNVAQGSFSPFSAGGWSVYLDGTGDVLTIPDSAISQLGSSDFTLECWINTSKTTGGNILTKGVDENVTWGNFYFVLNSSGYLFFEIDPTPSTSADRFNLTDTVAINNGQWHHVAVTRSGNDWKLFRNGIIAASGTSSASFSDDTYAWVVGGSRVSGSAVATWMGYISNLRLIKGSAVYTTAFTPPTTPLSAITNTAFLICHTNRFIDASTNNFAITVTGDSKVVAFSPFAPTQAYVASQLGGSAYFDGNDYLSVSDNAAFTLGTNSFTAEAWVYPTTSSVARMIMGQYEDTDNTGSFLLYLNSGNKLVCIIPALAITITGATNVPASAWSHVVITRSGSSFAIFLNGSRDASLATNSGALTDSTYAFTLGADRDGNSLLYTGYIASARLVNGTAVYVPTQTTITVPTSPPTAVPGTSLLLNFTGAGIVDSTGRNNLETIGNSAVQTTQSKWSPGSMYFDGNGDYLQSSAALSELVFLHNGTPWTADGWFYTGSTSLQVILGTDAASANIGFDIRLNDTTARDIAVYILRGVSGSWASAVSPTNSWNLNTWTHFAVTLDNSKNLTVYVNGVQVATASGSSFAFSSANPSYPLVVGRFQAPTPGGYFNGYMSDLRITRGIARYATGTGANANQMVFNGTNTLALPTRSFPLA